MQANVDFEPDFAPDGRIIDLLSGSLLEDQPEERVRQRFIKVLHHEYGYPLKVMRREVVVMAGSNPVTESDGTPTRADIVVYATSAAAASGDQGKIKFVVECKRPNLQSGYNQLVSYVFNTSASGAVWTNGDDVSSFRRLTQPRNHLEDAVGIPAFKENWDAVGRIPKSDLKKPRDVRGLLRICNNKLHGRGLETDEEDLTMDMVRIILAKAQDEVEPGSLPEFYVTAEEMQTSEGRVSVSKRVQRLFRTFADDNPGVFSEHEKITVSENAIAEVVAVLQRWQIMTRIDEADEWDVMGAAYEEYTHSHLKRARGQFFTNRLIVDLMVSVADPTTGKKVLDPAGGSGGFLTSALRHMRRKVIEETAPSSSAREHQLANLRRQLFSVEMSPRLVKIAKTAMLLNGDGHSGMTRGDSLGPFDEMDDWIKSQCGKGKPSVILTNPPFAGVGEGQISDKQTLEQFRVGRKWVTDASGRFEQTPHLQDSCPPELLFFERCLDWLRPGGVLGIVLPKSFLDTATYRPARELLFREAQLLGVVNLHKNTFQRDTGVRTCIIFARKLHDSEEPSDSDEIFMAISQRVGRDSEGRPIFKMSPGGETTDELDHDIDEILADYQALQEGELKPSEYRYSIKRSEIVPTLNINPQFYLPNLNKTLKQVQEIDEKEGWSVSSLSQVEQDIRIYKGPRLKTENLIVSGREETPDAEPYYTPSAILQDKRDSVKWLDLVKASKKQVRDFDAVRVYKGDILVTRSGSIGRLGYITSALDGSIVSDDAIRVRIGDEQLRAYVFAFLQSKAAQDQLRINEYGAIQQHLEPEHVAALLVPIPDDWATVQPIIDSARSFFAGKEVLDTAQAHLRSGVDEMLDVE